MKQKTKKIIGVVVTTTLIIIFVSFLGWLVRPTDCDGSIAQVNNFHKLPENSLEVIGYGSSHMWNGLNAMEMYEAYGIGAYNYGCNWQYINTTLLFMQDSFKTQSPKVVLVECFRVDKIRSNVGVNGEIYYTRAIPESLEKQAFLRQCFGNDLEKWLSYYMPLCAFHDNWSRLNEKSFIAGLYDERVEKNMGSWLVEKSSTVNLPHPDALSQAELDDMSIMVLDQIVDLCKENDTEIIFYTAPYKGDYRYNNAMAAYAEEKGCVYLNLFEKVEEIGLQPNDYYDGGHTNIVGATKVANYLGKYIVENYDVTDMRKVENNIWEQALQK